MPTSTSQASPANSRATSVPTFGMAQRSDHPDFYIRDELARPATTMPHRHAYFQIQVNLGGDTVQHIGGAVRPFGRNTLAFILPHRLHVIPHPEESHFFLINFTQEFLLPHLPCDPMDLEDVSMADAPELSPFRFQEYLDFVFTDEDFAEIETLLQNMRRLASERRLGSSLMLKGQLLQLLGKVCNRYEPALNALAAEKAEKRGRRDAMARVSKHIRDNIANSALTLKDAAAAAFLSPGYLTHLLRKETGSSFTDLVLDRRMRLARTQLIHSDKPVSHVAWACGFADEAYFSRRFKKTYGIAPGQFRRQQQAA